MHFNLESKKARVGHKTNKRKTSMLFYHRKHLRGVHIVTKADCLAVKQLCNFNKQLNSS